jgi:hypothetical protein
MDCLLESPRAEPKSERRACVLLPPASTDNVRLSIRDRAERGPGGDNAAGGGSEVSDEEGRALLSSAAGNSNVISELRASEDSAVEFEGS